MSCHVARHPGDLNGVGRDKKFRGVQGWVPWALELCMINPLFGTRHGNESGGSQPGLGWAAPCDATWGKGFWKGS